MFLSFYGIVLKIYGENSITSIKWPFALQQCAFKHTSILLWTYSSFLSRIVLYICGLVKYHVCMKYVALWVNTIMHVLYQMNNGCTVDHLLQKKQYLSIFIETYMLNYRYFYPFCVEYYSFLTYIFVTITYLYFTKSNLKKQENRIKRNTHFL